MLFYFSASLGGFFMSFFLISEDGYYALTKAGYISLVILLILVMLVTAFITDKRQDAKKINAKQLTFDDHLCQNVAVIINNGIYVC